MSRFEELVSIYFDGEPEEHELDELVQLLEDNPELAREFRERLITWECWSQEITPERSSDAFTQALRVRLHAESDADQFNDSTRMLIQKRRILNYIQSTAAIAALIAMVFIINWVNRDNVINLNEASLIPMFQSVSLKGECVCTKCTLHREGEHMKAIRFINSDGESKILLLKKDPDMREFTGHFCGGPTPASLNGETLEKDGQALLDIDFIEFKE